MNVEYKRLRISHSTAMTCKWRIPEIGQDGTFPGETAMFISDNEYKSDSWNGINTTSLSN